MKWWIIPVVMILGSSAVLAHTLNKKKDMHIASDGVYTIGLAGGAEGQYIIDTRFELCFFSRGERFIQLHGGDCDTLIYQSRK